MPPPHKDHTQTKQFVCSVVLLVFYLMWVVHRTCFFTTSFGDCFRSRVTKHISRVARNLPSTRDPGSRPHPGARMRHRSARRKQFAHAMQIACCQITFPTYVDYALGIPFYCNVRGLFSSLLPHRTLARLRKYKIHKMYLNIY